MKRIPICIFLSFFVFGIHAQNINQKSFELVMSYQSGAQIENLGIGDSGPLGVPSGPIMGQSIHGLLIFDILNNRLVMLNEAYRFEQVVNLRMEFDITPYTFNSPSEFLLATTLQGFAIFNSESGETQELWIAHFPEFRDYRSFAYYDDVLFVHDAELNLWSIPEPVMDQAENRAKLLNERQTREYVNERWGATGELQVDDEGRLFIDGQLVTRDLPTWLGERGITTDFEPRYIGTDRTGTTYWVTLQHLFISMKPVQTAAIPSRYDASLVSGYPTVEYQTGDIYFLGRPVDNNTSIPLYRIPNDWSPIDASLQSESGTSREVSQNPRATVINSRLRVRSAPSLEGEMLGMLEIGEEVRVLEKSDQELNIGELTDFWYRIDNGNGLTGWAYGAFLRMDGRVASFAVGTRRKIDGVTCKNRSIEVKAVSSRREGY
jgi:hypothetical protein